MRVDWCVSSWFRIKNTHSLTPTEGWLFTKAALERMAFKRHFARVGAAERCTESIFTDHQQQVCDYAGASELKFGKIPQMQQEIDDMTAALCRLLGVDNLEGEVGAVLYLDAEQGQLMHRIQHMQQLLGTRGRNLH